MSKHTVTCIDDINVLADQYGMPLEKMRFFIGVNNTEPKCFGIFQDEAGYWVVYKNKANGERAVRYRGRNEAEACQIIWDKIEEEIKIRKKDADWWQHQQDLANDPVYAEEYDKELERRVLKPNYGTKKPAKKKHSVRNALLTSMAVAGIVTLMYSGIRHIAANHPHTGYYSDGNTLYYYQSPSWYYWNDTYNDWLFYDYDAYEDNWHDWNYDGSYYTYDTGGNDYISFEDTDYYHDSSSSGSYSYSDDDYDSDWSSDWDDSWDSSDDYDYDFSDWDSDYTDWDSDW